MVSMRIPCVRANVIQLTFTPIAPVVVAGADALLSVWEAARNRQHQSSRVVAAMQNRRRTYLMQRCLWPRQYRCSTRSRP